MTDLLEVQYNWTHASSNLEIVKLWITRFWENYITVKHRYLELYTAGKICFSTAHLSFKISIIYSSLCTHITTLKVNSINFSVASDLRFANNTFPVFKRMHRTVTPTVIYKESLLDIVEAKVFNHISHSSQHNTSLYLLRLWL